MPSAALGGSGGAIYRYDPRELERKRLEQEQQQKEAAERQRMFQEQQQRQTQASAGSAARDYMAGAGSAPAATDAARHATSFSSGSGAGYSVDPLGHTSYNDTAEQARRTAQLQAQLGAAAEDRRLATLRSLMGEYSGGMGPSAPRESHRGASVSGNEEAARAAAFARAKDQTGELAATQNRAVESMMAGRGLSGSPLEALRLAGVQGGARGSLDDVIAAQLESDLNRQAHISDLTYQGGIQQRGQDMGRTNPQLQALMSLMSTVY